MDGDARRARLVLASLLIASLALITIDYRTDGGPLTGLRIVVGSAFGLLERAAGAVVAPVAAVVSDVRGLGQHRDQVRALERENAALRLQLRTSDDARRRAVELDRLLRAPTLGSYRLLPARVVAVGSALGFEKTVTLDAGSRDGVQPNVAVLNGDGLVGRVTSVNAVTATVLLVSDEVSSVAARVAATGELGVATGRGRSGLVFELLDPQRAPRRGDRLVTGGSPGNRPFVPGVPIGEVVDVTRTSDGLTRSARVRPFARLSALDLVGVVVPSPRATPRSPLVAP